MTIVKADETDIDSNPADSPIIRRRLSEMLNEKVVMARVLYFQPREEKGTLTLRDAIESNVSIWNSLNENTSALQRFLTLHEDPANAKNEALNTVFKADSPTVMGIQTFIHQYDDVSIVDESDLLGIVQSFHSVAKTQYAMLHESKKRHPVLGMSEAVNEIFGKVPNFEHRDVIQINFVGAYALKQNIPGMIESVPFPRVRQFMHMWREGIAGPMAGIRLQFGPKARPKEDTKDAQVAAAQQFGENLQRELAKAEMAQAVKERGDTPRNKMN